jgi:hypothetical protein
VVFAIQRFVDAGQQHLKRQDGTGQNAYAILSFEHTRTNPACTVDTHLGQLAVALALKLGGDTLKLVLIVLRQVLTSQASTLKPKVNVDFDGLLRHDIHLVVG